METVCVWKRFRCVKIGSYPTYEEWKHQLPQLLKLGLKGSYPTYEEWKHRKYHRHHQVLVRSYPTYEEWKLL